MAGKKSKKRQVHVKTPLSSSKLASLPSSGDPQDNIPVSVGHVASASEIVAPSPRSAKACRHLERGVNIDFLSNKISKSKFSFFQCKDCVSDRKGGKKKKGKASRKAFASGSSQLEDERWICLACGQVSCSSTSSHKSKQPSDEEEENAVESMKKAPTGHVSKHSLFAKHPLALQIGNIHVCWCFTCNKAIDHTFPAVVSCEDDGSQNLTAVSHDTPLQEAVTIVYQKFLKDTGLLDDKGSKELMRKDNTAAMEYNSQVNNLVSLRSSSAASVGYVGSQRMRLVRGMINLGNTCFFNSVMQNLLALDMLRNYFTEGPLDFEAPLTSSLRRLYLETNPESTKQVIPEQASVYVSGLKRGIKVMNSWENNATCNPRSLFGAICTKAPRFKGFQQQDSHELLRCLLEGLNSEERNAKLKLIPNGGEKEPAITSETVVMNEISISEYHDGKEEHVDAVKLSLTTEYTTFIESCFGGQICSTVSCKKCGHSSTVYEPMLDLSLQIPVHKSVKKGITPPMASSSGSASKLRKGSMKRDVKCRKSVRSMDSEGASQCQSGEESKHLINSGDNINMVKHGVSVNNSNDGEFGWLDYVEDFIDGGLQSADISLQGCQDPSLLHLSKENDQKNSIVVTEDFATDTDLATLDPAKFDSDDDARLEKSVNVDVSLCFLPSDEIGKSQDKLAGEEDQLPIASGILFLPYEPLNVSGSSYEIATLDIEQEGDNFDGFSQLFEEEESVLVGNQSLEISRLHSERIVSTTEDLLDDGIWEARATVFDEDDSTATPCISGECEDYFPPMSLEGCLADFTKTELLCGENAWECENCTKLVKEKSLFLLTGDDHSSEDMGDGGLSEVLAQNGNGFKMRNYVGQCHEIDYSNDRRGSSAISDSSLVCSMEAIKDSEISPVGYQEEEEVCNGKAKVNKFDNGNKKLLKQMEKETKTPEEHEKSGERGFEMANTDENRALCTIGADIQANSDLSHSLDVGNSIVDDILVEADSLPISRTSIDCLQAEEHAGLKGKSFTTRTGERDTSKNRLQKDKLIRRDATKRLLISKAPPILTVHLKRFAQDIRGRLNKLNGHISFPELLDLQPFLDARCLDSDDWVYRLVGIVEHTGTIGSGHYIAYVRGPCIQDPINDKNGDIWYHISDSDVQKATLQAVLNSEAYLLFYEKSKMKGK